MRLNSLSFSLYICIRVCIVKCIHTCVVEVRGREGCPLVALSVEVMRAVEECLPRAMHLERDSPEAVKKRKTGGPAVC